MSKLLNSVYYAMRGIKSYHDAATISIEANTDVTEIRAPMHMHVVDIIAKFAITVNIKDDDKLGEKIRFYQQEFTSMLRKEMYEDVESKLVELMIAIEGHEFDESSRLVRNLLKEVRGQS